MASNSGAVDTISGDLATQMAQLMASSGLGAGRPAWGPRGEGEGCSTNLRHGTGNQAGTRLNRPSVHSAIGLKHPDSSSVQNSMLKLVPPRHAMYVPRRAYLVRLIQVWTSAGSTGPFSLCKVEDDVNNTPYTSGNAPNPDLNKSFVANVRSRTVHRYIPSEHLYTTISARAGVLTLPGLPFLSGAPSRGLLLGDAPSLSGPRGCVTWSTGGQWIWFGKRRVVGRTSPVALNYQSPSSHLPVTTHHSPALGRFPRKTLWPLIYSPFS